jgi:hypothetical protein
MTSEERKDDAAEDSEGDLMVTARRDRRLSRASVKFFQDETSIRSLSIGSTSDGGLVDSEGRVRDEYILQRQSVNRPAKLDKVPLLCDLTTSSKITHVDGWVFAMLLVSGFAKMSSKTNELNAINVFPIADGDTGANMKVCLKLPVRNLLLKPNENIMIASRGLAADIILNG